MFTCHTAEKQKGLRAHQARGTSFSHTHMQLPVPSSNVIEESKALTFCCCCCCGRSGSGSPRGFISSTHHVASRDLSPCECARDVQGSFGGETLTEFRFFFFYFFYFFLFAQPGTTCQTALGMSRSRVTFSFLHHHHLLFGQTQPPVPIASCCFARVCLLSIFLIFFSIFHFSSSSLLPSSLGF